MNRFSARLDPERGGEALRDGDTMYLQLQGPKLQGVQHYYTIKSRLAEYDAPKAGTPEGDAATAFVRDWLGQAEAMNYPWPLRIRTHGPDKYGRELTTFYRMDGESLGMALFEAGHAVEWH